MYEPTTITNDPFTGRSYAHSYEILYTYGPSYRLRFTKKKRPCSELIPQSIIN